MTSHRPFLVGAAGMIFGLDIIPSGAATAQPPRAGQPVERAVRDLVIAPENDWQFQNVRSLEVDKSGRLYAWDSQDLRIRMFDAAGKQLRLFGRRGQGPGELSQTGRMTVRSDTIWIAEASTNRLTFFSIFGSGAQTTKVSSLISTPTYLQARLKSGLWMVTRPQKVGQLGYTHLFSSLDGKHFDTVQIFLPAAREFNYDVLQANVRNGPVVAKQSSVQPFLASPQIAPGADGARFIVAESMPDFASKSAMRLLALSTAGDTLWNRAMDFDAVPITDAHHAAMVDNLVAPTVVRGVLMAGSRRMIVDSLVRPRNFPAFRKLVVGADGSIWIERGSASTRELFLWRFSSEGLYETTVSIPVGFWFMAATRNRLYGSRVNADGEVTIERYKLKN